MKVPWEKVPVFVVGAEVKNRSGHLYYPGENCEFYFRVELHPSGSDRFKVKMTAGFDIGGLGHGGHTYLKPFDLLTKAQALEWLSTITWNSMRSKIQKSRLAGLQYRLPGEIHEDNPGRLFETLKRQLMREIEELA